jgi:hypothetical protein
MKLIGAGWLLLSKKGTIPLAVVDVKACADIDAKIKEPDNSL